jgi:hypothetical protein
MEPAQEVPGGLRFGGPEAKPVEPFVKAEEVRDYPVTDLVTRGRLAAVEKPHDVGVAVEVIEVVHVVLGEAAQYQAVGLQEIRHLVIIQGLRAGRRWSELVRVPGRPPGSLPGRLPPMRLNHDASSRR